MSLSNNKTSSERAVFAVYYLILVLMLAASFSPGHRTWGFNHWAYYPSFVAIGLFLVGALAPFILSLWRKKFEADIDDADNSKAFTGWAAVIIAVFMVLFFILRASTHYLGDGYQLLGNLATVNPWIKIRNLGEELIHKLVFNLLSGEESVRSLRSFQIVSYASGLGFLVSAAYAAGRLFERNMERVLFVLGLASSGYMLLFFGYVENYSVFVTMVMIYALAGLLVVNGKLKRWYLLIPLVLAILTHAFGVMLIPSAVYLLVAGTKAGDSIKVLDFKVKALISAAALIVGGIAFWYFYTNVYFFRFAFVPLVANRFTIESYTLFSAKHLIDILNLCFLLLPSFVMFIVIAMFQSTKKAAFGRDSLFLIILSASALGAAVLFDPKLGMPRDWDLFSFMGVPAALMCYYLLLKSRSVSGFHLKAAVLAIVLGLVVLLPRAVGRAGGEIEISHVENYIRLDVQKNKNLVWKLKDHYSVQGDTAQVRLLDEQWRRDFPERSLNEKGVARKEAGDYAGAVVFFRAAVEANPMHAPTYATLAQCYRYLGMLDSALTMLEIADGINPNSSFVSSEFAYVYRQQGNYTAAERDFQRAISIDNNNLEAYLGLLELYWSSGQVEKHNVLLVEAAAHPDAPGIIHKLLGDELLRRQMFREADFHYRTAIAKGLDSTQVRDILERINQLKK